MVGLKITQSIFKLFFKLFFFSHLLLCAWVFCLQIYHVCFWCSQIPEENAGSLGTGVTAELTIIHKKDVRESEQSGSRGFKTLPAIEAKGSE